MRRKLLSWLLALISLALISCAPSDPPGSQADPVETAELVRFDSQLGCSATYDPAFFTAEDHEDEYWKRIVSFNVGSAWENDGFNIWVGVEPLNASSVEEAVNDICQSMNLDRISISEMGSNGAVREEVTFGSGPYPAVRLTYNNVYAIGEIYVTEQNGTVYKVQVSSYHQPPKELLTQAYAILDSITF